MIWDDQHENSIFLWSSSVLTAIANNLGLRYIKIKTLSSNVCTHKAKNETELCVEYFSTILVYSHVFCVPSNWAHSIDTAVMCADIMRGYNRRGANLIPPHRRRLPSFSFICYYRAALCVVISSWLVFVSI